MENTQGVASEHIKEGSSPFLKGSDFDGGLEVVVVKMEKFIPDDAKYGVSNNYGVGGVITKKNWFIQEGILEEGQSFKYIFEVDGVEKEFDNSSLSFYFAFTKINPVAGTKLSIKRDASVDTKPVWDIKVL